MENISENNITSSVPENNLRLKIAEQKFISNSDALLNKSNIRSFSTHLHSNQKSYKEAKSQEDKKIISQEDQLKSSKILPSLDSYCKTDILNESADFAECKVKFKSKQKIVKKELFFCEICKEDITDLDVYNRSVHLNNCIDKQVSSTSSASQAIQSENIFILECPLCFKNFSSPELRSNHIKKCAKSKGLSVQSVIKALELQERHALEREALGLPVKPVKPVKSHKNLTNKRAVVEPKSKAQSDIQLAKALSLSLANSSQTEGSTETSSAVLLRPPQNQQNPGKKISRCKKGTNITPLLVLRTEEDRKKLLLNRVAAIVAPGETIDDVTTVAAEEKTASEKFRNDEHQTNPVLWHLSGISSEKVNYYVDQLGDWIKPSNIEVGTKLHHLSQIPGHEIVTQIPCDYTFNMQEENTISIPSSGHFTAQTETFPHQMEQLVSGVLRNLQSLVASSWMSDVEIETAWKTVIPAHKLIMSTRCPPLKKDMNFCHSGTKVKLKWENISFSAAIQFLNFVYTGNIEVQENIASDLFCLADKYEVLDLKAFLTANWKSHSSADEKSNETFFQFADVSSQCSEVLENVCKESEEATNEDLEIVYKCINSTLKPTQSLTAESPISSQENSPNTSSRRNVSLSPLKVNVGDSKRRISSDNHIISDAEQEECHSPHPIIFDDQVNTQNHTSPNAESEEYRSTSPVIFDVKDSDEDENLSDNENSQSFSFSQKLEKSQTNFEIEQLDLFNPESNSSEESVKILQSSFMSDADAHKQPEENDSQSCAKSVELKKSDSFSPNESIFENNNPSCSQKFQLTTSETLKSSRFNSDGPSTSRSQLFHINAPVLDMFSKNSTAGENKSKATDSDKDKITVYELESAYGCINTSKAEAAKSVSAVNSPYKDSASTSTEINNLTSGGSKCQILPEKRSPCSEDDSFIISKKMKYSSPQKYTTTSEILIFDSDDELKDTFIPNSENEIKLNHSNTDSVEKIRKNVTSPEIICCSSDYDINDTSLNDTLPIRKEASVSPTDILSQCDQLLSQIKSKFKEIAEKSSDENNPVCSENSPKPLQSPYQNYDEFDVPDEHYEPPDFSPEIPTSNEHHSSDSEIKEVDQKGEAGKFCTLQENLPKPLRSPYQSYDEFDVPDEHYEPPFFSPEIPTSNEHHSSDSEIKEVDQKGEAENFVYAELHDQDKADTSNLNMPNLSQKKLIHNTVGEKKINDKYCNKTATPPNKPGGIHAEFRISDSPITPLPDYKNMMTPDIKEALKRYGVKALPRRKAVAILSHIYNETHPILNGETDASSSNQLSPQKTSKEASNKEKISKSNKRKKGDKDTVKYAKKSPPKVYSQKVSTSLSSDSDDSSSENTDGKWQGLVPEVTFSQLNEDSPSKCNKDDRERVKEYITSNEDLYSNILSYKPLNIVEFHDELKMNGIKMSIAKLMDFLDEQCITFTCPRKEEYRKKQTARSQRFRKKMIAKLSQQPT